MNRLGRNVAGGQDVIIEVGSGSAKGRDFELSVLYSVG